MKNLALALGGLIAVLLLAFVFFNKGGLNKSDVLTEQIPVETPRLELLKEKESSSQAMKKQYENPPQALSSQEISGKRARIKTEKGDIVFELLESTPLASSNFIFLTKEGFYDGVTFHRREENFVIQGGDPMGNGTGGPGYTFSDEPVTLEYQRGIVAMANRGPNTNGSQFFIMLADTPLPKNYTIFGKVVLGMDVVDKIKVGDKMVSVSIE